jgi:hypothetical protein
MFFNVPVSFARSCQEQTPGSGASEKFCEDEQADFETV